MNWQDNYDRLLNHLTRITTERYAKQVGLCPLHLFATAEHGHYGDLRLGVTRHDGEDLLAHDTVPMHLSGPALRAWFKEKLDITPLAAVAYADNPITIARWETRGKKHWYELYYDGVGYWYKGSGCGGTLAAARRPDAIAFMEERVEGDGIKMKRVL